MSWPSPETSGVRAVLDPLPADYRTSRLCAAALGADLRAALRVSDDDIIRIATERGRSALCRVSGSENLLPPGVIRVDRFIRQSLKAYPHDRVTVETVALGSTAEVALLPGVDMSQRYDPALLPAIKRSMVEQSVAVQPGMLLYLTLPGRLAGVAYEVHFVAGGAGVVTDQTTVWLVDADHDHGPADHIHDDEQRSEPVIDVTLEDIGGLAEQIREMREFVELPLVFPQVYRQLGINPPRGVIFHGAPGTGKTLLARAIANEINAQLFAINGPEVVGTYTGETEANLRKIFAEAALNPPSIVFIDELDAIAPARRAGTSQAEARAVTQLLSLLDGLKQAEGLIVIGTTNRMHTIDPALRRAGRFDREIYFPTPSADAREQILRIHTREMPLDDEAAAALPTVARRAHGFVGADLMELSRQAGLTALRRAAAQFVDSPSLASYPNPDDLVVRLQDLQAALKAVRPAAMRGSLLKLPLVTWDDVGGLDLVKRRLWELVVTPLRNPGAFERLGLAANLGVLLHGPPGTGKTLLAKAIASEAGVNFLPVQGPELFSQWLGESEESVRRVFDVARQAAPCIVFFDQLDAVVPSRIDAAHDGAHAPHRVVGQILAELDGIEPRSQVTVIGATNRVSAIDPAALRPGRFGVHVLVDLPGAQDRAEILRIHLRTPDTEAAVGADLIDWLASRTEGASGADLEFVCQTAKLAALEDFGSDAEAARVERSHVEYALRILESGRSAAT